MAENPINDDLTIKESYDSLSNFADFKISPQETQLALEDDNRYQKLDISSAQKMQVNALIQQMTEAGRRWVPLDDAAREAIRDQMAINRALNPKIVKMQAPIFTAAKGGIIHSSIINQDMTKVCKKAGIEKATAHAFRATFVTRSLEQGLTMTEVGNVVGHKYATMTAEYNHTDRGKLYDKILTVNYM